ncbi:MAG: hypothetical protein KAX38_00395 [Candidatus Krumholzibacteria bacterium]|nr:hypothetical protein [Candidatus Krumholzibacteria bacterium]
MKPLVHIFIGLAIVSSAFTPGPAACGSAEDSLSGLLPASGEIDGWKKDGEPLVYYAGNLWEYIDGSAESFLAYEFKSVIAQDYISATGKGLKVEVYDHGSPLMAFGIYSQFRGEELTLYELGNEGVGDTYSLHFWKGSYYVRINVFDKSNELERAMEAFARAVDARITESGAPIPEISRFPKGGLVERSITYVTKGVLGRGKLPPAFIAEYRIGDGRGKLYLFPLAGKKDAWKVFDWYSKEIKAEIREYATGHGTCLMGRGLAPYVGEILAFHCGSWMGIITGFEDAQKVKDDLAAAVAGRITELDKHRER